MRDATLTEPERAEAFRADHPAWQDDEERWKSLTRAANDAYNRKEFARARLIYQSALGISESLLSRAERDNGLVHAPALFVVTHHNIAEVALAEDLGALAQVHYRAAFEQLLKIAAATHAPAALRQSCASHLQPALIALATHLQNSGTSTEIIACDIQRARCVITGPMARA